jgi:hypothetical protein
VDRVAQDIVFQGLGAPLRLDNAAAVLRLMPQIATGWPYLVQDADPTRPPFFTISAKPEAVRFLCQNHVEPVAPRQFDAVNAACDAIAALAQALAAEDDRLLCLHAAGVVIAGQLVVFPNLRRAGKSTLSAALAKAGHRVFSDDVLPLLLSGNAPVRGLAMGIAPRLRLPLPDAVGPEFRDWVAAAPGPQNRQYKYLALPGQPAHGELLPIAAFVILDRQDAAVAARLDPVPPDVAMDALLHQNFTRDRHSGDVLQVIADLLAACPVVQLTYFDLPGAVDSLGAAFARPSAEHPATVPMPITQFRPLRVASPTAALVPGAPIRQRPDTVARDIGDVLYLADPEGRAIHRMAPLAAAIWDLLETPATMGEIERFLYQAFPATDPARIAADLSDLLASLVTWGLVTSSAEV